MPISIEVCVNGLLTRGVISEAFAKRMLSSSDINAIQEEIPDVARELTYYHAIDYAVLHGDLQGVKDLIELGASFSPVNAKNSTPFLLAIQHGHIEIVKYFLETFKDNDNEKLLLLTNYKEQNALHIAAENNQTEITKILLEDERFKKLLLMDDKDLYGVSALHYALDYHEKNKGDSGEIVRLILDPVVPSKSNQEAVIKAKELINYKVALNKPQNILVKNLQYFLKKLKLTPESISTEGICNGLSLLHAHYHSRGEGRKFDDILNVVATWDKKTLSLTDLLPPSLQKKYTRQALYQDYLDFKNKGKTKYGFFERFSKKYKNNQEMLDNFFQKYKDEVSLFNALTSKYELNEDADVFEEFFAALPEDSAKYENKLDLLNQLSNDVIWFQQSTSATDELNISGMSQSARKLQYHAVASGRVLKPVFQTNAKSNILKLTEHQLQELLEIFSYWNDPIIQIGGASHATSLYIKGKLFYYDPNYDSDVAPFQDTRTLANHIKKFKIQHNLQKLIDDEFEIGFGLYRSYPKNAHIPELELPRPMKIPTSSANKFTKLHYAILTNNIQEIVKIVKEDPSSILVKDAHGMTPIDWAIALENRDLLDQLMKQGLHSLFSTSITKDILIKASNSNIIKYLLSNGWTDLSMVGDVLLTKTIYDKDDDFLIRYLRDNESGITQDIKNKLLKKALYLATSNPNNQVIQIIRLLSKSQLDQFNPEIFEKDELESFEKLYQGADYSMTPLMKALQLGLDKRILSKLTEGSDLQLVDDYKQSPLVYAINYQAPIEIIELILKKSKESHIDLVNKKDLKGKTPWMYIIDKPNSVELAKMLLVDSNLDVERQILEMAIKGKNIPLIEFFIERGAIITDRFIELAKDLPEVSNLLNSTRKKQLADKIISLRSTSQLTKREKTALLAEALKARIDQSHPELIEELISTSDVRITDDRGRTPILIAIENNINETIISKLLERENDLLQASSDDLEDVKPPVLMRLFSDEDVIKYADGVNSKDNLKRTVLMAAIQNDNKGLIAFLLKNGAEVDAVDSFRKSPMVYAKDEPDIMLMLKYAKEQPPYNVVLTERISDTVTDWTWVNTLDDDSMTPLMKVALTSGHDEQNIAELIKYSDINIQNAQGKTALIFAAETNNPKLLSQLLDAGAEVNKRDILGFSALEYAKNYPEIINILKKHQEKQTKQHEADVITTLDKPGMSVPQPLKDLKQQVSPEAKEKSSETKPLSPHIQLSFLSSPKKIPLKDEMEGSQKIIEIEELLQRLSSDMDSNRSFYSTYFEKDIILEIRSLINTYRTRINEDNLADFHSKTDDMLSKLSNNSVRSFFLKMHHLSEPESFSLKRELK